ncbi:11789_t:CDS:2, partial [Funneliformis mosseae]
GHSTTLVRARSMLRVVHSDPNLTTSMTQMVTQTKSFRLSRAKPMLRAGHSAPEFS